MRGRSERLHALLVPDAQMENIWQCRPGKRDQNHGWNPVVEGIYLRRLLQLGGS